MKRLLIFFTLTLLWGCIDVIKLNVDGGGALVVDGLITNEAGPYYIKLSRSIGFDNNRPVTVFASPERGAKITIEEKGNFSVSFNECDTCLAGTYVTNAFVGKPGSTYTLTVETKDGKKYMSTPETMPVPVPLKDVGFQFAIFDHFEINANGDPISVRDEAFNIYAIVDDPPGVGNFYRSGAYGVDEYRTTTDTIEVSKCWIYDGHLETQVRISDDLLYDGGPLKYYVCQVPYKRPTEYLVRMWQQSLTKGAYNYWRISAAQQSNTGSLFDPPPAIIQGNMMNVEDENETVLGYFEVSTMTRKNLLLDRFKAAGFIPPNPTQPQPLYDCRYTKENGSPLGGTNIRPAGFN